jgi:hypothetical protein
MGIVADIKQALESQIESILPAFSRANYKYDFDKNSKANSDNIYAVRIGDSSTVSGTNLTITQDRLFNVILSKRFYINGATDDALDEAIVELINAHELLQVELFQRKLGLQRVLVIQSIDISEPAIDNVNSNVNIEANYSVKFRLGV